MKLKQYLNESKGSYLDNKKMPREGQDVYILAGQMADKVVKGTVRKITNIDQKGLANTYFEIEANGKNHHINIAQVYDHKPKRVKTKDEYGEVTIWENKMDLVEKYIGETRIDELTKAQVFKSLNKAMSGSDYMNIDQIVDRMQTTGILPMSKSGLEAHLRELVRKGKAQETMKKGKYVYKI